MWTLGDCIQYAKEQNISIQQSRLSQQEADISYRQAKASYWPSLSFSTGHNYTNTPFGEAPNNAYSGNAGLNLGWQIYNGSCSGNIKQQKISGQSAALQVSTIENSVVEQIMSAYVHALYAKEAISVNVAMCSSSEALYQQGEARLLAVTYLQGIYCSAITEDMTDKATEEITAILRANHKLSEGEEDDFNVRSQQELSTMMTTTTDLLTVLLACIAGISLVVGGIGIMNIMYVSVTERTREIGLRMSVGARGADILAQFLIEAIFISVTGGIIGVLFGIGASYAIKFIANWPIAIQGWTVLLSFAVCTVTGIFFGYYPAKKAANLDPIEAIRYE